MAATNDSEIEFEQALTRTAMGVRNGGWMKLIEDNAHSLNHLTQIRERLENILSTEKAVFTDVREKWMIAVTKAELKYCNKHIEQLLNQESR